MSVSSEADLTAKQRGHWVKAVAAIELRNFGYAIDLLQDLLVQEPAFLACRRLLRRTEIIRGQVEKRGLLTISTTRLALIRAQRELKNAPQKTIELVEKVLATNPYDFQANLLLKDAAIAAGYPEIGIFALETLLEKEPRDVKLLHELGRLYSCADQSEKAVETYNRISEIDPLNAEAARLGKDALARASMRRGGWAEATSYRDLIKDKGEAAALEREQKIECSDEALDQQISQAFVRHVTDPQNVELAKRLGLLHDRRNDTEGAIAWYQYALALTNGNDVELERKIVDLQMRQLDRQIREHEHYLAEHTIDNPSFVERRTWLEAARKQRDETLISAARKRLDHNPSDLQLRLEFGECLVNAGYYRGALPELQRARQSPNARLKSMNLIGRCYCELGMLDLAARQLEEAAGEGSVLDALTKETLYNLGLVYERMGQFEKHIETLKKIFEIDYGYRDVARRVESFYGRDVSGS
jgi:tetratricopeptide (TPR) repeat protein